MVTFISEAPGAAGDANRFRDVFVRDRVRGRTARVSVSFSGAQSNGDSGPAAISADGRYVAFVSRASNLVPGDKTGHWDLFLRDLLAGRTMRVAGDVRGVGPSISGDGRFVTFEVAGPGIAVFDRKTGTTENVSPRPATQGEGSTSRPAISADGRYVAYVFVSERDCRPTGPNVPPLVEDPCAGAENECGGPADELCALILVYDREKRASSRVGVAYSDEASHQLSTPAISKDGRYIVFSSAERLTADDANDADDLYLHDRASGRNTLVSISDSGEAANSASNAPSISADGRSVAFMSLATNLVPGDSNRCRSDLDGTPYNCQDIFLRDTVARRTTRVSVSSTGRQARGDSRWPSLSAGGRFVAFQSPAANLVPGDTNGNWDVFVRDLRTGRTERVSVAG